MTVYCTHLECRQDQVEELVFMSNKLGRQDLLEAAHDTRKAIVRCRKVPPAVDETQVTIEHRP